MYLYTLMLWGLRMPQPRGVPKHVGMPMYTRHGSVHAMGAHTPCQLPWQVHSRVVYTPILRVMTWENRKEGGLRIQDRHDNLQRLRRTTHFQDREIRWAHWLDSSHSAVLVRNKARLREQGITATGIQEALRKKSTDTQSPRDASPKKDEGKRLFQRTARGMLLDKELVDTEGRLRQKLARWKFIDRRQAARCARRLRTTMPKVPPRVAAAMWGCIWNRWATARRHQTAGSQCLLGCDQGEDAIEHYARCPAVKEASAMWGISFRFADPLEYWTLVAPACADSERREDWWRQVAYLQYAVLRATNAARSKGRLRREDAVAALRQAWVEGHGDCKS